MDEEYRYQESRAGHTTVSPSERNAKDTKEHVLVCVVFFLLCFIQLFRHRELDRKKKKFNGSRSRKKKVDRTTALFSWVTAIKKKNPR